MSRSKRAARQQKIAARMEQERRARRRVRLQVLAAAGAGLIVLVVLVVASLRPDPPPDGITTATDWDLPALGGSGERVALADFRGKPTVTVFFASWCDVCEHEMPGFVALSDQLGDRVNWVGVNSQDNGRGGADAARWGIADRWPLARDVGLGDGRGLATGAFQARGMPLTVVYDADGEVVHVQRGGINASGLFQILDQAFGIGT